MIKINKIILTIFITFVLVNIFNNVYAAPQRQLTDGGGSSSSVTTINPDSYKPSKPTTEEAGEVISKVGVVLGAIRNISVVVAVIALMIIGFKYIIGSAEEKANYKTTLLPYIIGAIVAVSGTTIVSFIYNAVN